MAADLRSPLGAGALAGGSRLLFSPSSQAPRRISRVPHRVLDAPQLIDDFYFRLVSWSVHDVLAVALGRTVYLWNARDAQVSRLTDLAEAEYVTSLNWSRDGSVLAVGTNSGCVELHDAASEKHIRDLRGHTGRAAAVDWHDTGLATGGRDRQIRLCDPRAASDCYSVLMRHQQEVCGLRWTQDGRTLASGGNDNSLFIWSAAMARSGAAAALGLPDGFRRRGCPELRADPIFSIESHRAAVKALDWCPWEPMLLASGGGTQDRTIRFTNCLTGQEQGWMDTRSQVCNVLWSRTSRELLSTHGYSNNYIHVWSYPSMRRVATLSGHTSRVLHVAASPDGETVVTGAGDETLRFWKIFPARAQQRAAAERHVTSPLPAPKPLVARELLRADASQVVATPMGYGGIR